MKQITLCCSALFITFSAIGQKTKNDIGNLFSEWNNANGPGGVVLVTHKNQIVFSNAYGLANITYGVPVDTETLFNIGSLSKQFTAMAIVLLQLEGKLSVDDEIQKYLPEMPYFDKPITIRHLLHHTSGLRSSPELFGLAGWRDGDAITNDDVYRYLAKQVDLNFEAGSEYMYSNSGYILLAKIIENVTKQDFKNWLREKIFQPFQMNSTFIEEDHAAIVSKIASSYTQTGPAAYKNIENYDLTFGASNVYTTGADLLKWTKSFQEAPKEWKSAFALLETLDDLNSGKKNNYAFGIVVDDFFGNRRIQHTGGIAGFQSIMYCYPDEDLEIVILSNFTSNQLDKIADQISQLFLENKSIVTRNEVTSNPVKLNAGILKKHEGMYWNDTDNYSRKIYLEGDVLWYLRSNNKKSPLIPVSETEFQMGGIDETIRIKFEDRSNKMQLISSDSSIEFEKYEDKATTIEELTSYTGKYYSPELETSYTISLKEGQLYGYHSRFGEFEINILKKDVLSWSGMLISKYVRDKNGKALGMKITMNRIRNLWFEKR
ncbi:MAG TPA: serine hydrolase domain-containing protein [Flavobacterium sp.]|jgi:CubicO group peptidase (beta-lactamase class C family)